MQANYSLLVIRPLPPYGSSKTSTLSPIKTLILKRLILPARYAIIGSSDPSTSTLNMVFGRASVTTPTTFCSFVLLITIKEIYQQTHLESILFVFYGVNYLYLVKFLRNTILPERLNREPGLVYVFEFTHN